MTPRPIPTFEDFAFVSRCLTDAPYVFAKTMPQNPHWYTLRKRWINDDAFVRVVKFMRAFGYTEYFRGRPYTMLNVNDHKYWTMGAPIPDTILINRKPHDLPCMYDQIADQYDRLFTDPDSLEENEAVMARITSRAKHSGATNADDRPLHLDEDVLDIGCGTGLLLDYVTPKYYTGIDPSRAMLDRLITRHPGQAPNVIHTRFEDFAARRYSLVVSLFASASYIQPYALRWIPRITQPGGRFFIMLYKPGYFPVTYQRAGVAFPHHDYQTEDLIRIHPSSTVTPFNNFLIWEGDGLPVDPPIGV